MRRFLVPSLISVIIFFIVAFILSLPKYKPTEVTVSLNARVLDDDIFQLFYWQDGQDYFSEKQSTRVFVKGNSDVQNIKFIIPANKLVKKIRIDIGENKKQKPISLNSVKLEVLRKSYECSVIDSFTLNRCIDYENDKFVPKTVLNIYDPWIISNFNVTEIFEEFIQEQTVIKKSIIYAISVIFSIAIFMFIYLKNIRLTQVTKNGFIFVFIVTLIIPSIYKEFAFEDSFEVTEKRELASKPDLELSKEYSQKYENYYNDNFGLRLTIIRWISDMKYRFFKVSPKPELVKIGKKGFLFYNSMNIKGAIYPSYSNSNIMSISEIEKLYEEQLDLKNKLATKGITYLCGCWPNKHTIYNEMLPSSMQVQIKNDTSLASQISYYFNERGMSFFDVTKDLLNAKKDKQLYYKFDTHWNEHGAYEAYKSFCKQTFSDLGLSALTIENFNIKYIDVNKGDLTNMIGIEGAKYYEKKPFYTLKDNSKKFKIIKADNFPKLTTITVNENCINKKVVLIFHDSYMTPIIQFFSLHFSKVVYIWQSKVDLEIVNKVKPDVVISVNVERRLFE